MTEDSTTYERPQKLSLHGFDKPDFVKPVDYDEFSEAYNKILTRRHQRWVEVLSRYQVKRSRKLKRFCRKGIPDAYRGEVWMKISGAEERMNANRGVFAAAVAETPPQSINSVIQADIPRTFPENIFFRDSSSRSSKLRSLQRVLSAFAVKFPKVGYCQVSRALSRCMYMEGFNYITAILLLVLRGRDEVVEEQAFWLLDALINHLLPSYYADEMVAVRRDCMVLGELLRINYKELYQKISDCGVNYTVLCTKWFICLYADVLPVETTLRVFDSLFYEGDKILFRAGLALVKLHYKQLLTCNEFPTLLTAFRNMCRDHQTLWCHEFMQVRVICNAANSNIFLCEFLLCITLSATKRDF
ncbi:Growth hormone regulated TBC protein 1 A [Fasciolopsis buskii]|uniref:Growth hormone regulated TBC protein 1 A n=1 Tax=Fasciolopsis buskii TaxID=27845 RepID=A0A8E0RNR2_9TREM|nr:Growth hormone regulated TBC protein 1 A [Fasciolopsis buski]